MVLYFPFCPCTGPSSGLDECWHVTVASTSQVSHFFNDNAKDPFSAFYVCITIDRLLTSTNVTCEKTLNCDESFVRSWRPSLCPKINQFLQQQQTDHGRTRPVFITSCDKRNYNSYTKSSYRVNPHKVLRSSSHNCPFGSQRLRASSDIFVVIVVYF